MRKCSHLSPSHSHVFLADGNPDEEEIGACGVGRSKHYLGTIYLPTTACAGFYSLFSVTEEPWVSSGGTPTSLSGICLGSQLLLHIRKMDGLLLEGREGSGQLSFYTTF